MIEDCFEKWYSLKYPDINPLHDDFYKDLLLCYEAGWKRALEVEDALQFLTALGQKDGEYD